MEVVDLKELELKDGDKKKSDSKESTKVDPEDILFYEWSKVLEKLEKGVDGDLVALSRAVRSLNRFRCRFTNITWGRIIYLLVPESYREEFQTALTPLYSFQNVVRKEEEPKEVAKGKQEDVVMTDKTNATAVVTSTITTTTTTTTATATATGTTATTTSKEKKKIRKFYPETYIFMKLLVSLDFFDKKQFKSALQIVEQLIRFMKEQNRRTSDLLSARAYQLYSLSNQKLERLPEIRQFLFTEYQTACLQQNEPAQSVLINLLLQNYLTNGQISLARKFVEKAIFPESSDSQQFARFHYYRGRIDTIEVHYPQALFHIQQALRRAPQNGAIAFQLSVTKWLIVVHLLMGDIPDRAVFSSIKHHQCQQQLEPYLKITEAVRMGDLKNFAHTLQNNDAIFKKDGLFMILQRLRHNVIKTGLRKINKSYSRISLIDICRKLSLDTEEDAYYIVGKAIRDGVIAATIDFEHKWVQSKEVHHVYSTDEPYQNFATRIRFCFDIHTQAIKSLRYPPQEELAGKKDEDDDTMSPEEVAQMVREAMEEDD